MNKCLNCGKPVKNKYCNTSCQNIHQGGYVNKKYGEFKKFIVTCNNCKKEFEIEEREKLFPKKEKYYCSRSCANSRDWDDDDKKKKSESLIGRNHIKRISTICKYCNKIFEHRITENRIFCSNKCSITYSNKNNIDKAIKGGRASVLNQNRRSKNEIYFSELCKEYFNNIKTNESIFNGWDADIIIEDYKIAILWNGKWHYEKIKEKHSIKQVKNRDRIKIKEIKNCGYIPYVIKDMGRENNEFVENEFEKLKKYIDE